MRAWKISKSVVSLIGQRRSNHGKLQNAGNRNLIIKADGVMSRQLQSIISLTIVRLALCHEHRNRTRVQNAKQSSSYENATALLTDNPIYAKTVQSFKQWLASRNLTGRRPKTQIQGGAHYLTYIKGHWILFFKIFYYWLSARLICSNELCEKACPTLGSVL